MPNVPSGTYPAPLYEMVSRAFTWRFACIFSLGVWSKIGAVFKVLTSFPIFRKPLK